MFRVTTEKKAALLLQRTQALLGRDLDVGKCEQYWKIPELWTCAVTTGVAGATAAEQVLDCLLQANCLGTGWHVLGPVLKEDQTIDTFIGVLSVKGSSKTRISGLEWGEFAIVRSKEI